ncbi:MAG TPA: hypothetical protein VHA75_02595 [Rugosimonospora sp.]|nr:hypothetical protein [Rugosimonospora sp.]
MTTQHFSKEPPDETILADALVTEIMVRFDAAANDRLGDPDRRWYPADGGENGAAGARPWSDLAGREWQRLYRQSDVDAAVADAIERTKAGIDAAIMAQMDRLWNNRRLRENGTRCGGLEEAGHIARTWTEAATR